MKIPFGTIDEATLKAARSYMDGPMSTGHLTEGVLTTEFEHRFAQTFGWKFAIAVCNGTAAGEVLWRALASFRPGAMVPTPACAFVATANCLSNADLSPVFIDVEYDSLNMSPGLLRQKLEEASDDPGGPVRDDLFGRRPKGIPGIQFVATMGSLRPVGRMKLIADEFSVPLIGDLCEAHGAWFHGYAGEYFDAAIYSLYPAHLVVGVEGGVICTNDFEIASKCRSIKSHGRPVGSNYFDFQHIAYNAKWSDLHAAVALASLEDYPARFTKRCQVREALVDALSKFEDDITLWREAPGEIIAPHAFPVALRNGDPIYRLYQMLEGSEIECKTLFGSLPTQHAAYAHLGHRRGEFPTAERLGVSGLHFGCGEFIEEKEVRFIVDVFENFFRNRD